MSCGWMASVMLPDGSVQAVLCEQPAFHRTRHDETGPSLWVLMRAGWHHGARAWNLEAPVWAFTDSEQTFIVRLLAAFYLPLWCNGDDWRTWRRKVMA